MCVCAGTHLCMHVCICAVFKKVTSKDVLAQIDATGSLAHATTSNVEDSIKDIWVSIVEPNPKPTNSLYISDEFHFTTSREMNNSSHFVQTDAQIFNIVKEKKKSDLKMEKKRRLEKKGNMREDR